MGMHQNGPFRVLSMMTSYMKYIYKFLAVLNGLIGLSLLADSEFTSQSETNPISQMGTKKAGPISVVKPPSV